MKKLKAFTIVELLVVIVVIGILATITVMSYSGISQKASLASLQSDLANAANKLKAYQVIYGSYPTLDASNCPSAPAVDVNYCLKFSPSSSIATTPFAGYVVNNTTTPKTFSLTLTNNDRQGVVTESSKPSILTPAPLDPVADWIATPQGDHYGNYYDPVSKSWATVTRSTPKTIYDPATQHIYDVPANYLAINPWSAYQPGGNGSAAVIEEARTNYLVNSYGVANTGGKWNGARGVMVGCSGIAQWSIRDGVYSSTAQQVEYTGVSADTGGLMQFYPPGYTSLAAAPGESFTASVYVRASMSEGATALLYLQAFNGSTYISGVTKSIVADGSWHRVEVTYPSLPANTTGLSTRVQANGITDGRSIDIAIDAYQLEKGTFATSYIPTTNVIVLRNADAVTISTAGWEAAKGTFASAHGSVNSASGTGYLFSSNVDGLNRTYLAQTASGVLTSVVRLGDNPYNAVLGGATGARVSMMRYAVGEKVAAFSSGLSIVRGSTEQPGDAMLNTTANIGHQGNGAYTNAPISRLVVYSNALSDTDIQSLSTNIKDGP